MRCSGFLRLVLFVATFCVAVLAADGESDYYKVLGIDREADQRQIKRAFRKLSVKYHPDKNVGDADAAAKFSEISSAYEVLSNEEKRQIYDIHGDEGLKKHAQGGGMQAQHPFASMFGGGQQQGGRRGPDFNMDFATTLEELYNGAERSFKISRKVVCRKCRGTGAKGGDTKKCKKCKGQGTVVQMQQLGPGFNVQMQAACDACGGKGQTFLHKCDSCKGAKLVQEDKELSATIERGMKHGEKITFERMSEQSADAGLVPGNVVLNLKCKPHARFVRKGNDLHHDMTITLREALLGFSKQLPHLDKHVVTVAQSGVTYPGQVLRMAGEGMPQHNYPSQKGTLFVKFKIKFPKVLTEEQKKLAAQLLDK
jgi:DnaJ-related protein SCJ1